MQEGYFNTFNIFSTRAPEVRAGPFTGRTPPTGPILFRKSAPPIWGGASSSLLAFFVPPPSLLLPGGSVPIMSSLVALHLVGILELSSLWRSLIEVKPLGTGCPGLCSGHGFCRADVCHYDEGMSPPPPLPSPPPPSRPPSPPPPSPPPFPTLSPPPSPHPSPLLSPPPSPPLLIDWSPFKKLHSGGQMRLRMMPEPHSQQVT